MSPQSENVKRSSDCWVVITFARPPRSWGFREAKSGKAWFRSIQGKAYALELGQALAANDIHGVIRRSAFPGGTQVIERVDSVDEPWLADELARQAEKRLAREQEIRAQKALAYALRGAS